jgi:hypothetical protein
MVFLIAYIFYNLKCEKQLEEAKSWIKDFLVGLLLNSFKKFG